MEKENKSNTTTKKIGSSKRSSIDNCQPATTNPKKIKIFNNSSTSNKSLSIFQRNNKTLNEKINLNKTDIKCLDDMNNKTSNLKFQDTETEELEIEIFWNILRISINFLENFLEIPVDY